MPQDSSWQKSMKNRAMSTAHDVFVHDDHAAGTHDGAQFGDLLVVDGCIQMLDGNTASGRTAQLGRFEFLPFGDTAADVIDDRAEGGAHGNLHESDIVDVAGQGKDLGSLAPFRADDWRTRRAPLRMIWPILAKVSTLFRTLGLCQSPAMAGKGGRGRGIPRFPSMEVIRAVSSPQTKAPAPW